MSWQRRLPTTPRDVDRSWHLASPDGDSVRTLCNGRWPADDAVEVSEDPPVGDRCAAFTAAFTASVTTGVTTAEIACAPTDDTATADTRPLRRPAGGAP